MTELNNPMRILLVEDDRKAARVLKKGLEEEGFIVDAVLAGDEGEYLAAINDYDLIVLDWLLPGRRASRSAGSFEPGGSPPPS